MSYQVDKSDLAVDITSKALVDAKVDLIVSGSIAAVESVRFARSLRRLGAEVYGWLTPGAKQFVGAEALSWATTRNVTEDFHGSVTHLASRDACIIAPASANLIAKIASGTTDSPAAALIQSYLGQGKPVCLLPNMHDSLWQSPFVKENVEKIKSFVHILQPRVEEGKRKFPTPEILADECAHYLNQQKRMSSGQTAGKVLVTLGPTRAYIDDVRYVSNYSSGSLGTEIAHELYRLGFQTSVVAGPAKVLPDVYSQLMMIETNDELKTAATSICQRGDHAIVMAAAVLDFVPEAKKAGKTASSENAMALNLVTTPKILPELVRGGQAKVGFKLETDLDKNKAKQLAHKYFENNDLTLFVANRLDEVSSKEHKAYVFERDPGGGVDGGQEVIGKTLLAHIISDHVLRFQTER